MSVALSLSSVKIDWEDSFRRAAESIIAISAALPEDVLDDIEGSNAYSAIGDLLKQVSHIAIRFWISSSVVASFKSASATIPRVLPSHSPRHTQSSRP